MLYVIVMEYGWLMAFKVPAYNDKAFTIRKFRIVRQEGKWQVQREIDHYTLDMIISVGYRVESQRGVQFRWALKDHLVQGYPLNQRRLTECGRCAVAHLLPEGVFPIAAR
ncbi:virulence RhuM family protein [Halomonas qaidamensis]|uniref:Virulence RhuM family protein n=1 Tax=Halomonas qaidamensis TaxID=2866211 RepID=A0ABY6JRD4_9GAMM|nr:virulence RhuM family protein [Halomonas qaidamensis]UYV19808.1 virulence RhuM family protein [Halomonas qaidamensis]